MSIQQASRTAAALLLTAALLCSGARAEGRSGDVISTALGEVGYTEGDGEYSKYGAWYGLSNSYWCDMFVSWCAYTAGIPKNDFPRHCTCTSHVKLFEQMGRYQASAARGGAYVPLQGDVIFFYNPLLHPTGSVKNHTGLVLYTEGGYVYTIEGNALANRLDIPFASLGVLRDDSLEPPDYVTVNRYPLDDNHIHGYGVPAYRDRTPLELTGFVDLGRWLSLSGPIQTLCDRGVLSSTSTHTFSPNHGMTREEFLEIVTSFFGLSGCEDTSGGDSLLSPDAYISPASAQDILWRAQEAVGLEPVEYAFSDGDYSYILERPYIIRADVVQAFYDLLDRLPQVTVFSGAVTLNGLPLDWPVLTAAYAQYTVCYVPLESVQQLSPLLTAVEADSHITASASAAPLDRAGRVLPETVTLQNGPETAAEAAAFTYRGVQYVALRTALELLGVDVAWTGDASGHGIELTIHIP